MDRSLSNPRLLRLGREFLWVAVGQGLVALGGLVGVRLLTEVLPPRVYGELALAMTIVAFVQVTVQQPLFEGARRFFQAASQAGQATSLLAAIRRLANRLNMLLLASGVACSMALIATGYGQWLGLTWAALAVCLVTTWSLSINGILNASRQRALIAGHEGLQQWLRFAIAAGLVWWIGPFSSLAMAGYALAAVLVLMSQHWMLRRILPDIVGAGVSDSRGRASWEVRVVAYGWPFALWGAALTVQTASARWSLQLFEAAEVVGFSAVLYHVGHYPVSLAVGVLSKFVSPVMFNRAGAEIGRGNEGAVKLGRLLVASAVAVTLVGTAVAWQTHEWIFALLVAPEYRSVSWLLPGQVLASGLLVSAQSATLLPLVSSESKGLIKPKIVSAGVGTALNAVGAWQYGLVGVVFAGVLYGAISYLWIARIGHLHEPPGVSGRQRLPANKSGSGGGIRSTSPPSRLP